MGLNECIFSGRFTKQPEVLTTSTGKTVCKFSLAVNEGYGDNGTVFYPRFIAWEKTAEYISRFDKGDLAVVKAKYGESKYTGKDGEQKYSVQFTVKEFVALPKAAKQNAATDGAVDNNGFVDIDNADLPF